jgi:hypothetical protein
MALSPIERPSLAEKQKPRTQFTIDTAAAGSSGTVYTVPEGKVFIGYKITRISNSNGNTSWQVNGVTIYSPYLTTYGADSVIPVYLGEGDVVSNNGSTYFSLTGYEE